MRAGAGIQELNALRKHLLAVGGGRLARASGAGRIEVLAVSDVPGDDPAWIGSGPCAPDPSRFPEVIASLERRGLLGRIPTVVRDHLERGARGALAETPKPGAPGFDRVHTTVVATNGDALEAAARTGRSLGLEPIRVTGGLRGEARLAGRRLAALAIACRPGGGRLLLAGGETVVTVRGPGRGGRSQELALAAAIALEGRSGIALLAAGTDGIDGPTDAAGAFADGQTVARGRSRGVDAVACLSRSDSHGFFEREGGLLRTGPTGTNVMDLVLIRVGAVASC
jgi:glycerate 2-kinase